MKRNGWERYHCHACDYDLCDLCLEHHKTSAKVNTQLCSIPALTVGTVVSRGPDWKYGDEDGGTGGRGRVVEGLMDGRVKVNWERSDGVCDYRYGEDGYFDVSLPKLAVGDEVERGPHWQDKMPENDGGVGNIGRVVRVMHGRVEVKWSCISDVYDYKYGEESKYEVKMLSRERYPYIFDSTEIEEEGIFECIIEPEPTKLLMSKLQDNVMDKFEEVNKKIEQINDNVKSAIDNVKVAIEKLVPTMKSAMEQWASDQKLSQLGPVENDRASEEKEEFGLGAVDLMPLTSIVEKRLQKFTTNPMLTSESEENSGGQLADEVSSFRSHL